MIYSIPTKLVGVSFKNEDGSDRQELIKQLKSGDDITIEPEPDNKYDSNSHIIKHNDKILGHIKRELAKELVEKKQKGEKIICIKDWNITGQEKHNIGLNILIELESGGESNG